MIIRRISYFTFMVAITTMATVSSCQKANAASISAEDLNTIIAALSEQDILDFGFQYQDADQDYNGKLQKLLQSKGLRTGTFQIKATRSGKDNVVNLILVVDKNYKGSVASSIFDSQTGHLPIQDVYVTGQFDKVFYPSFFADIRKDIARRNRVLLI